MKDIKQLSKVIPFHFRLGNGVGKYEIKDNKKIYEKYSVLGYIDARDAEDLLDEVCGADRQCDYKEIKGNLYCGVFINGKGRWNCGTESNTEKEKGEASDAFKRACVKRGIGRFLYSLPTLYIARAEAEANKYDFTEFIKKKFKKELTEWHKSLSINKENEAVRKSD